MRVMCAAGIISLSMMCFEPVYAWDLMTDNTASRHGSYQRARQLVTTGDVARNQIIQHVAGCPRYLFCGCAASAHVFGNPVRSLYLVRNWYQFPRVAPAAGMAVLFGLRHVAIIEEYHGDGTATLYDPNSGGGLTRLHRVKIAGLLVVDPHGQQNDRGSR